MSINQKKMQEDNLSRLESVSPMLSRPLGEMLLERGIISRSDLEEAVRLQQQHDRRLGEILIQTGALSDDALVPVLAEQWGVPTLDEWLDFSNIKEIDSLSFKDYGLPGSWWVSQKVYPLLDSGGELWLAMIDVLDSFTLEAIKMKTSLDVKAVAVTNFQLRQLLSIISAESESVGIHLEDDDSVLQDMSSDAPIIRFVNEVINRAIEAKASDVHFENYRGIFRIRYRIDGVLREVDRPGKDMQAAVISRLKLMAKLDISERRIPQDGRIRVRIGGADFDIRVATSPGIGGESIVLRLLTRDEGLATLDSLRMRADHRLVMDKLLTNTSGIILVTGPTGSGKTTSLYGCLQELLDDERKIITVEDPVEYQTRGITQIQVNTDINLTFASALRSILRQDPDIILIGEIRDQETAQIAVQAALTGHLVLSTLHTNDAAGSFARLIDLGVPGYLLSSSILGVLAQRLVRTLCSYCADDDNPTSEQLNEMGWSEIVAHGWNANIPEVRFKRAKGCDRCLGTGYSGRRPIFEVIGMDKEISNSLATASERTAEVIARKAVRTLRQDGLLLAAEGKTSITEVLRVTG